MGQTLAQGGSGIFTSFIGGLDFLSIQNIIWGNYSLSIGALMLCIFVGWKWGVPKALASLEDSGNVLPARQLWSFLIRFVCPLAVGIILVYIIVTQNYF